MSIGNIVENFPLSIHSVLKRYTRIPRDATEIFYHYTSQDGIKGILKSGGLRATHRNNMNDPGEFTYPMETIRDAIEDIRWRNDLPNIGQRFLTWTLSNLQLGRVAYRQHDAHCACLTVSGDDLGQWTRYADEGRGYAIGFNMMNLFTALMKDCEHTGRHFLFLPVIYDPLIQRRFVYQLFEAAISDMQRFSAQISRESEYLTRVYRRILKEVILHLTTMRTFMKDSEYEREREIRITCFSNTWQPSSSDIQYRESDGEPVSFLFFDFRNPVTGKLPLSEILIGPEANIAKNVTFLENLFDELGYSNRDRTRPAIRMSTQNE